MELKAYWLAIKVGWKIILGVLVVTIAAAALLTWQTTPQYVSSTSLFVAAQTDSENLDELFERNALAQQRVSSYVVLATSGSVAAEVGDAVGFAVDTGAVTAIVVPATVIIQINVTDPDPERARDIAAAYGEVLPTTIEELEQVRNAAEPQVQLTVIDEADLPTSPAATPAMRNMAAAIVLGLGLGMSLALLRYVVREENTPRAREKDAA